MNSAQQTAEDSTSMGDLASREEQRQHGVPVASEGLLIPEGQILDLY